MLAAVAGVLVLGLIRPPATAAVSSDRAATHAYILAYRDLEQAIVASAPARVAAVQAEARAITQECPGALALTPVHEPPFSGKSPPSPRQIGEFSLHVEQLGELTREVQTALSPTATPSELQAVAAFSAATRGLRWSSPTITRGVGGYVKLITAVEAPATPELHVCADIEAWVASGYRRPTPATKALAAQETSIPLGPIGFVIAPDSPRLRRFEGSAEKRLIAQTRALEDRARRQLFPLIEETRSVETKLGVAREPLGYFSGGESPRKGSVVLGRGRTAAGERFVVRFEPAGGSERRCALTISNEAGDEGGGSSQGSRTSGCSFRTRAAEASVNCANGKLTIESKTLPTTRLVRLSLSNGASITTPPILIPRRQGGPAGVYYQVVRGPSPIPVSLTELDRQGHVVRTVHLPAIVECTKHPLKFLPGGIRTLVRSRIPGGSSFTIEAQRYRFLGAVHLDLKANIEQGSPGRLILFGGGSHPLRGRQGRQTFALQEETGCKPTPFVIAFGLLHRPADTVLARTSAGLVTLHKTAMPASLHARGALAWGVITPPPSEVLVEEPGGRVMLHESLAEVSRSQVEQCEGETEPPAP